MAKAQETKRVVKEPIRPRISLDLDEELEKDLDSLRDFYASNYQPMFSISYAELIRMIVHEKALHHQRWLQGMAACKGTGTPRPPSDSRNPS